MGTKIKILVVEDNQETQLFLQNILSRNYEVILAENAILGMDYARNQNPDLIIMDIMLPMLNGYEACKMLKDDVKTRNIPIIFLSAKGEVEDITKGLKLGGDDYLPKPFDYKILQARIEARLREVNKRSQDTLKNLVVGDLVLDNQKREVSHKGKVINLTLTEFDILRTLVSRRGDTVSREDILKEVWGENAEGVSGRTIDVHIRSIRKKAPEVSKSLSSVYGVGYKFE